jgi:hypothetical protein
LTLVGHHYSTIAAASMTTVTGEVLLDARLRDKPDGVGRCPLLRPSHQPIKGTAGALALRHGGDRAQARVHQDAGQSAWADPKLLSLPRQSGVSNCQMLWMRR